MGQNRMASSTERASRGARVMAVPPVASLRTMAATVRMRHRRESDCALTRSVVLIAVAIAVGAPAPARATTVRFTASADTYATAAHPRSTHGGLRHMDVAAAPVRTAYVRFRVRGLEAPVARATLRLYA